jgi:hypothetical protein
VKRDIVVEEFERSESKSLLAGAGLTRPNMNFHVLGVSSSDNSKRSTVSSGSKGSGIANGHYVVVLMNQFRTVVPDCEIHFEVFALDVSCFGEDDFEGADRQVFDSVKCPEKINGGRSRIA